MNETATPTGVIITATDSAGHTRNITQGVQVLYDLVIQSMDWGSGFLSVEDVRPVVELATFCGFKAYEAAEEYMAHELEAERQRKCPHAHWHEEAPPSGRHLTLPGQELVRRVCDACGLVRADARPIPKETRHGS